MATRTHIPFIELPGSKSISNRLLMIKAIGDLKFNIENISDCDDTTLLIKAIHDIDSQKNEINIGDAGTNMRFLCSYLSALPNRIFILTGSERMKQRPIKELVDALTGIGAEITYLENPGYPPIKIIGQELIASEIALQANISSQFISSILLTTPLLKYSNKILLNGNIVSSSYISMTIELMRLFGKEIKWLKNNLEINPGTYKNLKNNIYNESDWSASSYFYCAFALSNFGYIELNGLLQNSIQADSKIAKLFEGFGIHTTYNERSVTLSKSSKSITHFSYNFTDCPDIAQTMAVTCLGLGITAELTGLKTLKIKETDRIIALKNELEKFGAIVEISSNSLYINGYDKASSSADILVNTYNDHRMAMSFAPLKFQYPNMIIENKEVVSKSFPHFWKEFSKLS